MCKMAMLSPTEGTLARARDRQAHQSVVTIYCLGGDFMDGGGTCLLTTLALGRRKQGVGSLESAWVI